MKVYVVYYASSFDEYELKKVFSICGQFSSVRFEKNNKLKKQMDTKPSAFSIAPLLLFFFFCF